VLGHMGIVEQPPTTPINIGPSAPFFPPLVPFLLIASITTTYNIDKRIPTPLTASSSLFLFNIVRGKSHFEATTESRQRRDTRPNSFQLLPQLAVGFSSDAGAVHERASTNLGRAAQDLGEADGAVVVFARELAVAEARRSEEGLAIDWAATNYMRIVFPWGEEEGTYPGVTQFTMTLLELRGDRAAICLMTKIVSSFETL
jgi:hypothetical protein